MKLFHITLVFLVIIASGVCFAESVSNSTGSDTSASTNHTVSLLFVQEGGSGSLIPIDDGNFTLTMNDVVPYTLYFSDRPDRIAGFYPMEKFISGFDWNLSPNAAISLAGVKKSEDTMIVELSNPTYDAAGKTMEYTVHLLKNYNGDKLKEFAVKSDANLPEKLGKIALFIDNSIGNSIYNSTEIVYKNSFVPFDSSF